jgi:predicted AAA+ superfamily ATPase
MPVVAVTGLRQTGKSTFLQQQPELKGRKYITLDDFAQMAAAKENPDKFVDSDEPLTIDEAQRCPELFIAIKRAVDRKRRMQHTGSKVTNTPTLKEISAIWDE